VSRHGAEQFLPLTPLAQWMRDTTGIPDPNSNSVVGVFINGPAYEADHTPLAPEAPGTLTVDDVLRVAEVDPARLRQAALDAILSYAAEGHAEDAVDQHRERIWALHDQILGETVG
jgi:hypothetical protein